MLIPTLEPYRALFVEWFEEQLGEVFSKEEDRAVMVMATVEALNNAAEHGNRDNPSKKIKIDCFLKKDMALLAVTDEGPGFTPVIENPGQVRGGRSRGLGLISANTDLVFFNASANQIIMFKGASVRNEKIVVEGVTLVILNNTVLFISRGGALAGGETSKVVGGVLERLGTMEPLGVFLDLGGVEKADEEVMGSICESLLRTRFGKLYLLNVNEDQGVQLGSLRGRAEKGRVQVLSGIGETAEILAELLTCPGNPNNCQSYSARP